MARIRQGSNTQTQIEKEYLCCYANKFKCKETFNTEEEASRHAILSHNVSAFHKVQDGRYKCPFKKELNCPALCQSLLILEEHLKIQHLGKKFPCTLAEDFGCTKRFSHRKTVRWHIDQKHRQNPRRHPCPLAEEIHCDKTFWDKQNAKAHANAVHVGARYPCPVAEQFKCPKDFSHKDTAYRHSKKHLRTVTYPCPMAEEYSCGKHFADKAKAKRHTSMHTHPFICPRKLCRYRFTNLEETLAHADDPGHAMVKLYRCPLTNCRCAVTGFRFGKAVLEYHWKSHIKKGHVRQDDVFEPEEAQALPIHSTLPLYSDIIQHGGLNLTNESQDLKVLDEVPNKEQGFEKEYEGTEEPCEDLDVEFDDVINDQTLHQQSSGHQTVFPFFSPERRLPIQEQNAKRYNIDEIDREEDLKVSFRNLGLTCVGPARSPAKGGHLIFGRCPEEVTIDLDTSYLCKDSTDGNPRLRLNGRCVACSFFVKVTEFFTAYGVDFQDEGTMCQVQGCDQIAFHKSGRCLRHLDYLLKMSHQKKIEFDIGAVQKTFNSAACKTWSFPPDYNIVRKRIEEIQMGKRPGSDLVILDDEFSPASRQLWEFTIIERVSGRVLISTCVEHKDGVSHHTQGAHPWATWVSRLKAQTVYSPSHVQSTGRMNADQIALKLREAGITQDTVFLVYHQGKTDLSLLKDLLESAGHYDVLPPNRNCVPILQLLRPNLSTAPPGYKRFLIALEILFPIMFPRHPLIGLNYRSQEDCLQTRLICMAFDELCKPVEERGEQWRPDTVTRRAQRPITDWLSKTRSADIGLGKRKRNDDSEAEPKAKRMLRSARTGDAL